MGARESQQAAPRIPVAYELVGAQPVSLVGLSDRDRASIVVAAVADHNGTEHVVSRFGDTRWDLRSLFKLDNVPESRQVVIWPEDCPAALVDDFKAVLYAWFKRGRPPWKPPGARSLCSAVRDGSRTLRWLAGMGLKRFDQIRPIHISNYLHFCKEDLRLKPTAVYNRLALLDLLWAFRVDTKYAMPEYPWGELNLGVVAGRMEVRGKPAATERTGKTPVIPPTVQSAIFNYCERVIGEADALLDARDAGKIAPLDDALLRIRDAGLYLLSISTGMRNSEATGLENDSWRTEKVKGVTYHWVRTVEQKTGKGLVEYLAPPETLNALRIVQRYAKPLQERLAREINRRRLEAEVEGPDPRECLQRLYRARKSAKKLFIGANVHGGDDGSGAGGRIDVLTEMGCGLALDRLARAAGTNWNLTSHQCRRTYARMFVESKMGRVSLIFLKWQLKHTSMSMTQLYAANPLQDAGLYGEFIDEMSCLKVEIMESWLSDAPLSGGAGRKITELRAIPIADRALLLKHTADSIHIRPTGHAWCLAQERGCGGAGLYEATRCVDCKSGVIDESFASVWQGIHAQQLELLDLDDAGPAVQQRAQREVRLSRRVLEELGVTPMPVDGLSSLEMGEGAR
ncbi:hypothetical protein A9977_00215 [Variovorax sp. UMC13]|nr:hypothetical protein [Variovorax sp. UMC13]